jgi:ribosomal protein L24E
MPVLADSKSEVVYRNARPSAAPYTIADGQGLFMLVKPNGTKTWFFRYRGRDGKQWKLGIKGSFPAVSLKQAREEAGRFRGMLGRGEDPREVRFTKKEDDARQAEMKRLEEARNANTFEKVALEWHKKASKELAPGNARETLVRLQKNVFPWIGSKPIVELRPPDILKPLHLVEQRGARESAHRILGVCSQIFRFAVAAGTLERDPTRDLRGALARPVERHFAALTRPEDVAGLLRAVDAYTGGLETCVAL